MEDHCPNLSNPRIQASAQEINIWRNREKLFGLQLDPAFGPTFHEESTGAAYSWPDTETELEMFRDDSHGIEKVTLRFRSCFLDSFRLNVDLSGRSWFGGCEMALQSWPLGKWSLPSASYLTSDIYKGPFGGVLENYWLSSARIALTVPQSTQLCVGFDSADQTMEFTTSTVIEKADNPCKSSLQLHVWMPNNAISLRSLHLKMLELHLGKPTGLPYVSMLRSPIWSTWARFKKDINERRLLEFAEEILQSGLSCCQMGIDDGWAGAEGDLAWDPVKFPDPHALISALSNKGLPVTLWVHPFFNADSATARDARNHSHMVSGPSGPALWTQWWNGKGLLLDATRDSARSWFISRLRDFQMTHCIHSFKFDAGEVNWIPPGANLIPALANQMTSAYAEMAASMGPGVEVRVGHQTQHLPLFVRVMDKDSKWGPDNGLQSLIPTVLTISILGYPFVLPDMVGGNAYGADRPDTELFIRWIEVTALLPAVQYSLAPWDYGPEVLGIAQKMSRLRKRFQTQIEKLALESTLKGSPVIRPMWWLDESISGLRCDSQFLLGDDIVVAPAMEPSIQSRVVLLPPGTWLPLDSLDAVIGPTTIRVPTPIDHLPIFVRESSVPNLSQLSVA